jgi:hyperosmotically inducible periplasmic protein
MRVSQFPLLSATVAAAVVLSLAACDKSQEGRTAGQAVDSTIAKMEKKSDQAAASVKEDLNSAKSAVGKAVEATTDKVKDAAITTNINAELAKDAALSPLKINVDTSAGQVLLRGTAPSAAARDQATMLAQRVEGVVRVDNQLQVSSN